MSLNGAVSLGPNPGLLGNSLTRRGPRGDLARTTPLLALESGEVWGRSLDLGPSDFAGGLIWAVLR